MVYGDWALVPHEHRIWHALEGAAVIVKSKLNDRYLRFDCVGPAHACETGWNQMRRGIFSATREEALADERCQFLVRNKRAGYYLWSVKWRKEIHALAGHWFPGGNLGWARALADSDLPESNKDLCLNALLFMPMVVNKSDYELTNGNYRLTTALQASTQRPEYVAKRISRANPQERFVKRFITSSDSSDPWWKLGELISVGDTTTPEAQRGTPNELFDVETIHPPDTAAWLARDDNQVKCIMKTAGDRQYTSCASVEARPFMHNVTAQDNYMIAWCRESRNRTDLRCNCIVLADEIEADPDLKGLSNPPPAVCSIDCSSKEGTYKTDTMSRILAGGNCRTQCQNIIKVTNSILIDRF